MSLILHTINIPPPSDVQLGIFHYNDVIMSVLASKITSLTIVYSTIYSGADERKRQSSAPLAFVRGIHRWPVNSPHKWPVTRKMFPFDDVIMPCPGRTRAISLLMMPWLHAPPDYVVMTGPHCMSHASCYLPYNKDIVMKRYRHGYHGEGNEE